MPRKASKILSKKEEKAAKLEREIDKARKEAAKAQKVVDKLIAKRKSVISSDVDASPVNTLPFAAQISTTEGEVTNVQS